MFKINIPPTIANKKLGRDMIEYIVFIYRLFKFIFSSNPINKAVG